MSAFPIPQGLVTSVSGIRGRVGVDLTPEVMARVAACHGFLLLDRAVREGRAERRVVVGRDSRPSGPMLRDAAVAGLLSVGCDVVDLGLVPTPTTLLAVKRLGAAGGLVVTASHNPAEWNAAKLASARGMFLTHQEGREVLALLESAGPPRAGWDAVGRADRDETAVELHLQRILAAPEVDPAAVRARRFRVVLDACSGVGALLLTPLLQQLGCRVDELHARPTGRFPREPEPVAANLRELSERVRAIGADLGMAVDPDGDRLALVRETGEPAGEEATLALAVERVLPSRPGPVVTNLSTSRVVADLAARVGCEVVRTSVGEIHVAERMVELGSSIGGEGNGGVIYPAVHPTRDAGSAAALVLSLLAARSVTLGEVLDTLPRYVIVKETLPVGGAADAPELERLEPLFAGAAVDRTDGLRLEWPAERAWLHVRRSGTEPLARLIAEAPTRARALDLVDRARRALGAGAPAAVAHG